MTAARHPSPLLRKDYKKGVQPQNLAEKGDKSREEHERAPWSRVQPGSVKPQMTMGGKLVHHERLNCRHLEHRRPHFGSSLRTGDPCPSKCGGLVFFNVSSPTLCTHAPREFFSSPPSPININEKLDEEDEREGIIEIAGLLPAFAWEGGDVGFLMWEG